MIKQIFAGVGLGLLVGSIIGLSIAEVTGIILGALTSILAAFFGLRANKEGETGNQVVIGAFGFACFFGIIFGIYSRTHDLLAQDMKSEFAGYLEVGFDSTETKQLIKLTNFGILPDGHTLAENAQITQQKSGVLFSAESDLTNLCADINPTFDCTHIENIFSPHGLQFERLVLSLKLIVPDNEQRKQVLLAISELLCYGISK